VSRRKKFALPVPAAAVYWRCRAGAPLAGMFTGGAGPVPLWLECCCGLRELQHEAEARELLCGFAPNVM